MPHFIYCGYYYYWNKEKLQEMSLAKMREYGLQSAVLTIFGVFRRNLITKEKTKMAYEKKLKNVEDWDEFDGSMNDDLELYFENLQLKKEVEEEEVNSFFLPKLTNDELKLVEEKNFEFFSSYGDFGVMGWNPDVDIGEMKKSNSKSKYSRCTCGRKSFPLKLELNKTSEAKLEAKSSQTVSDDGSENLSEGLSDANSFQSPHEAESEASETESETSPETSEEFKGPHYGTARTYSKRENDYSDDNQAKLKRF